MSPSFVIYKPVDMGRASGLLWHDVPNRGRRIRRSRRRSAPSATSGSRAPGRATTPAPPAVRPTASVAGMQFLQVPVARGPDGAPVTGEVFGRIVNRSGPASQPLIVQTNPVPYKPVSLDTTKAKLVSRGGENQRGEVIDEVAIPAGDWAWARCDAEQSVSRHARPDADLPEERLRSGARSTRWSSRPRTRYVLGIGFAAWRDVGAFFKNAAADDAGTPNPIAGRVTHSIARGISQSGNFLRGWLHLGFNQDEDGSQVHDGVWPIIAGRRIALNFRWAQPDGVLELYQAGSEGPQWWVPHPDPVRGLPDGRHPRPLHRDAAPARRSSSTSAPPKCGR